MKSLMKIPLYIPFFGILISVALLIFSASSESMPLIITGIVLFHLSGWILAAKFLLGGVGFFSSVLSE